MAGGDCSPTGDCTGASGTKNYDGGDCLPGNPGPIPGPSPCSVYTSGTPYEGIPDCPECVEYCLATQQTCGDVIMGTCWKVCRTFDGAQYLDDVFIDAWPIFNTNITPAGTAISRGRIIFDITYTGPTPFPDEVRVQFYAVAQAGITGTLAPISMTATNGFGDPFIPTSASRGKSEGTHIKTLGLDAGHHVRYIVQQFAMVIWADNQQDGDVSNDATAVILQCE
jgi:hypothetical protein